jgi:hypothetical protein
VFAIIAALTACTGFEGQLHSRALPPPGGGGPDPERPERLIGRPSFTSPWARAPEPDDGSPDGAALYAAGAIHDIHLTLSDSAIASLRDEPTVQVTAGLELGDVQMDVALRLKGNSSFQPIDQKPSFKIDVHEYNPAQRIDGEKRLTLNNMIEDPTMMREHSYYWLAARFGAPAPRQAYARVWVNGAPYGLYTLLETMDEELIEHAFKDDEEGNLYEASGSDFNYARDWFDLEETGDVVPWPDDIEALVDAVEASRDGDFWAMLNDQFDIDHTLSYWAIEIVAGNDDGYVFNHHNYLVYHAPLAGTWSMLPWGTDRSFSREVPPTGDGATPIFGELVIRCWEDDACGAALSTRIEEVLVVWDAELGAEIDDTWGRIEADCEADGRKRYSCRPDNIREFVDARAEFLRGYL